MLILLLRINPDIDWYTFFCRHFQPYEMDLITFQNSSHAKMWCFWNRTLFYFDHELKLFFSLLIFDVFLFSMFVYFRCLFIFDLCCISMFVYFRCLFIFDVCLFSMFVYFRCLFIFDFFFRSKVKASFLWCKHWLSWASLKTSVVDQRRVCAAEENRLQICSKNKQKKTEQLQSQNKHIMTESVRYYDVLDNHSFPISKTRECTSVQIPHCQNISLKICWSNHWKKKMKGIGPMANF